MKLQTAKAGLWLATLVITGTTVAAAQTSTQVSPLSPSTRASEMRFPFSVPASRPRVNQ